MLRRVRNCRFIIIIIIISISLISVLTHDKNDVIPRSWYTAFSFLGEYSKLDKVKTMGIRGKIDAI